MQVRKIVQFYWSKANILDWTVCTIRPIGQHYSYRQPHGLTGLELSTTWAGSLFTPFGVNCQPHSHELSTSRVVHCTGAHTHTHTHTHL